jgi:hypothetical protein
MSEYNFVKYYMCIKLINLLNTLKHDKLQYLEDFQKWFKLINNDLLYYLYHDEYRLYMNTIEFICIFCKKNDKNIICHEKKLFVLQVFKN